MKFLSTLGCTLLLIFSTHTQVFAQEFGIHNLSHAINESGRLRMLSQRLAKAYLLRAMDIQPQKAQAQFQASQSKFENNLQQLTKFSETLGSTDIQLSLQLIQQEWQNYKTTLAKAATKDLAGQVLLLSDRTLMACETLVKQLEKQAKRQSARWVNLSGRQRMLSQRIAKFYSAISLSGQNELYATGLNQAVQEFEAALNELSNSPDNTHFVNHKLQKVATQWHFSKQGFKLLEKGATTPLVISMTTETILKQMNDITALYQQIDQNKKDNTVI